MDIPEDDLAARLAEVRSQLDYPPGVIMGVLRLPILDPLLDDLEAASAASPSTLAASTSLLVEITRTIDVLTGGMLGTAQEAVGRRARLIELLCLADGGRLPPLAFDPADAFGDELRTLVATDRDLALALGRLHPLLVRATTVAPSEAWRVAAMAMVRGLDGDRLASAAHRSLAALLRAEIVSRPDLLVGGLRLVNQRLVRGLLWFVAEAVDQPAELLREVGLRMGTSGRSDAVARDIATANTCAALLAATSDPDGPAGLASMRLHVMHRTILKHVDRALADVAGRRGIPVAALIEDALPAFGLGSSGRVEIKAGDTVAVLRLLDGGNVRGTWRLRDGRAVDQPPAGLATGNPGAVADVDARAKAIEAGWAEERSRMESRLASTRSWPEAAFRARFVEHPIGGAFGRRLVWAVDAPGGGSWTATPAPDGWIGVDGRRMASVPAASVRLWHPADSPDDGAAWRAAFAISNVTSPIRQVDRETFRVRDLDRGLAADRRFAGRIVDHTRMRTLLRQRNWAVPALGVWDQGDEASAWRAFDDGLRAELRYQAVELVPTGERQERARLVAVRFVTSDAPPTAAAGDGVPVALLAVPARVFSEAIRDVSLVVAVGGVEAATA